MNGAKPKPAAIPPLAERQRPGLSVTLTGIAWFRSPVEKCSGRVERML